MDTANKTYDVIVIGAGWSGLMACKYCVAEGLRTVVLESRDRIGGVWAYTDDQRYGGVMKSTHTTSSRCVTEMSDFPMPDDYPNFPSHEEIRAYLEAYCARFSLTERIRFNRRVTRASKRGDLWRGQASGRRGRVPPPPLPSSRGHQQPQDLSRERPVRRRSRVVVQSAVLQH